MTRPCRADQSERRLEGDERHRGVRWMDDIAWTTTEDRVELVLAADRKTLVSPSLVAGKPVPVVPAPRSLTDIAGQGPDVANLGCGHGPGRVGPKSFPEVDWPEALRVPPPWEGGDGKAVNDPDRKRAAKLGRDGRA